MIKICHLADIHIRPYKYLDEMEFTFNELFNSLSDHRPDLIVIAGDTFHSKLTVSSEYFDIASKFLRKLSDFASIIIIPGNHDMALNNHNRLDAISPVVNALDGLTKYPICFSKVSEAIKLEKFKNVFFHHFSILEKKEKWPTQKNLDESKINIALYHGTINGIVFDNGWISRGNKDDIDIFNGFDFAFLGDIHKHQFLDADKRVAYPGSLRQNNYSEDVEKGYLLWEIENKNDFNVQRIVLPQKRYFFTLYGESVKDVRNVGDLPEDCRIRFQLTKHVDSVEELKIKAEIEKLYKPSNDVPIIAPHEEIDIGTIKVGKLDIVHENIRVSESQTELLKEYFKDKNLSKVDLKDLIELDKLYHSHVDSDVVRNVNFKLGEIKWDNMFSYGKGNVIDFRKLKGLIGILGENWIGKSSIMDVLTLCIYNQVFKEGANKSIDYINRKCKNGSINGDISMNGKNYHIFRSFKKRSTKKGEDKCDTEINFTENGTSANGETKPDTNKLIRNRFGTDEDFAFTSLCSQFGLTRFIDARGTKRKEILAKYFDLDVFDTKFQVANEDYKKLKGKIEEVSFSKLKGELSSLESEVEEKEKNLNLLLQKRSALENEQEIIEKSIDDEKNKIQMVKNNAYDIQDLNNEKHTLEQSINNIENELRLLQNQLRGHNSEITREDVVSKNKKLIDQIKEVKHLIDLEQSKLKNNQKSIKLLETIPNVDECRTCTLAKRSYEDKDKIVQNNKNLDLLRATMDNLIESQKKFNYDEQIKLYDEHEKNKLKLEKKVLLKKTLLFDLEKVANKIEEYEKHKASILLKKVVEEIIDDLSEQKTKVKSNLNLLQNEIIKTSSNLAICKDRIELCKDSMKKIEEWSRQKYIYELYLDAMGKNGISYWIISKKVPIVNKHVNHILSQCVSFKLQVENNEEEKSIKVFINDEKGKRPIELGSGAEKTISSIALRAALWSVCLLPKTPILILDEAFSYLDNEKYDGVTKLLTSLKTYFDAIIVITHDESLKSVMDDSYYITRDKKGYATCKIV